MNVKPYCKIALLIIAINPNLTAAWVGKVRKKGGRKGGEKKRAQRARARGSNPGPAAC